MGGWWSGSAGCAVFALTVNTACEISLFSITAIALDRYISVFYNKAVPHATGCKWISLIWFWISMIIIAIVWNGSYADSMGLTSGNIVCEIAFWDKHQYTYIVKGIAIFTIVTGIGGQCYSYFTLVVRFRKLQRQYRANAQRIHRMTASAINIGKSTGDTDGASSDLNSEVALRKSNLISKTGTKLLLKGIFVSAFFLV